MTKTQTQTKTHKGGTSLMLPQTLVTKYPTTTMNKRENSNNRFINELSRSGIDVYNVETTKKINSTIDKINMDFFNTTQVSYLTTKDYNKYRLIPGQLIAYGGGFGISFLKHYGVYMGYGLVYELAPQSENKNTRYGPEIAIGISKLSDFVKRGQDKDSPIYTFDSVKVPNDNKKNIKKRLDRILETNQKTHSRNKQLLLYGNCEHVANKIAYDTFASLQADIISGSLLLGIILYKYGKYSSKKIKYDEDTEIIPCKNQEITIHDCVCEDSTDNDKRTTSWISGNMCTINPKISCNMGNLRPGEIIHLVKKHNNSKAKIMKKIPLKLTLKKRRKKGKLYKYTWKKCVKK